MKILTENLFYCQLNPGDYQAVKVHHAEESFCSSKEACNHLLACKAPLPAEKVSFFANCIEFHLLSL